MWCCSRGTASALRAPALASTPGTGTAASGDVTASGKHRFVAHVGDEPPDEIHEDDVERRYGFSGALVPGVELFARTTTPLVAAWEAEWLS